MPTLEQVHKTISAAQGKTCHLEPAPAWIVLHTVVAVHRTSLQRVTCNGLLPTAVQTCNHHASVEEEQHGRESA